jgi:hypothetical protein
MAAVERATPYGPASSGREKTPAKDRNPKGGYSSLALFKVPGRAKRLPNALVLLNLSRKKQCLRSLLGFSSFLRYRGSDIAMEMLIAAKDHRGAQAACSQRSALA